MAGGAAACPFGFWRIVVLCVLADRIVTGKTLVVLGVAGKAEGREKVSELFGELLEDE